MFSTEQLTIITAVALAAAIAVWGVGKFIAWLTEFVANVFYALLQWVGIASIILLSVGSILLIIWLLSDPMHVGDLWVYLHQLWVSAVSGFRDAHGFQNFQELKDNTQALINSLTGQSIAQ